MKEHKYKNVVFLILDALGDEILNYHLSQNCFLQKNKIDVIPAIYPSTTTAATTSYRTGLTPIQHGYIGWFNYFKEKDKYLTLFTGNNYYDKTDELSYIDLINEKLNHKTIIDLINEKTNVKASLMYPQNIDTENGFDSFQDMCNGIQKLSENNNKNFMLAYWPEPDSKMHEEGTKTENVKKLINELDSTLEKIAKKLKDTLLIISADHGQLNHKNIVINEIPELDECLIRKPSIEFRITTFFVKEKRKEDFIEIFEEKFGKDFLLFTKDEFLKSNFLGKYENPNKKVNDFIGDFVSVSISDKSFIYSRDMKDYSLIGMHAGLLKEEMLVHLIVYKTIL
jgi:predicted AlkP superfamily pyrophosphatase or phosphodiesterase